MATMQAGFDSGGKPLLHACAYVSFQELATRVSHRNTGRYCEDPSRRSCSPGSRWTRTCT